MASNDAYAPLSEWGDIDDVLDDQPEDVAHDAWWISVLGCCLCCPCNLLQGCCGGCFPACYRWMSFTGCCSAYQAVVRGRPLSCACAMWRYSIAMIVALVRNHMVRLSMFMWENEAFGGGDNNFWHGEGVWTPTYKDCEEIMRSNQKRTRAFGCIRAACPDMFPPGLLIFLPNTGTQSEWWAVRQALHTHLLDLGLPAYKQRIAQLKNKVADEWPPEPKLLHLDSGAFCEKMVAKCLFWVMFGIWVTDPEAQVLRLWKNYAKFFIIPRLGHRMVFNLGIKKVQKLRKDTVRIIEDRNLQHVFVKMNDDLPPKYRRDSAVQLCDEIMYVFGFAGIGGTSNCMQSVGKFLQTKIPQECPKDHVDLSKYPSVEHMVAAYKKDPDAYIKESVRLDPPVTSATTTFDKDTWVDINDEECKFPKGMLRQYCLSMANRDETVFEDPELFNPDRPDLAKSLTWNGAFGTPNDANTYPRMCPGRTLSLEVCKAIANHAVYSPTVYAAESDSGED